MFNFLNHLSLISAFTTVGVRFAFFFFYPKVGDFEILGISSFAIPINKNMIPTYLKKI